ncbi:MAG: A24 family peptidase [Actinomycetota bacterium]
MTGSIAMSVGLLALGLVIGPVLGILVDRTVERLPLRPTHRCTTCSAAIGRRSLIPVRSWFDRCWSCGAHKGLRYPLVDGATALVFAMMGLRFGSGWLLIPYLGLAAILIVLSAIDAETHLLPNIITWPAFLAGLFVVLVVSGQRDYAAGITSALVGAAVFTGFIGLAHLAHEQGMGRGDVKLSMTLGLFIGWLQPGLVDTTRLVLITILIALVGGAVGGIVYNLIRRRGRAEIPFGPALATATLAVVVVSGAVIDTVRL